MLSRGLPAGFIAPCLPTKASRPPSGEAWLHEIEHDGFRIIARKDGERVRLFSRPGNDLTYRFPLIVVCRKAGPAVLPREFLRAALRPAASDQEKPRWARG
jgi:ATP-dependent DNA ligase